MGVKAWWLLVSMSLVNCTEGHCRRQVDAPEAAQPLAATGEAPNKPSDQDHVFVYKYDGSLQCGMGKPVAVEAMAKELQGVPVLSSKSKNDGLMHIQVCGSVTGKANIYEIPAKFLKQAEIKGFKKWTFE